MIEELGRRGLNGHREAGAFLLGARGSGDRRVKRVVYFDDLDSDCLVGNIHIRASGFSRLWDLCESETLQVIADVHTHPGITVSQSDTDRDNPMIALTGHIAIIVPCYGTQLVEAHQVGVHEYRGECGWKSWFSRRVKRVLRIVK